MHKLAVVALLITSVSCGTPVTPEEASAHLAMADCAALNNCGPFLVSVIYGDVATCATRNTPTALHTLMAPSTSLTPALLDACASALDGLSCAELITSRSPPAACRPVPGLLTNGQGCGDDWQCQSTYCRIENNGCGACADRVKAGAACNGASECDFGLACSNQVCVATVALGAACTSGLCQDGTCVNGICTAPGKLGADCATTGTGAQCDTLNGLACVQGKCQTIQLATAGQPCGTTATGVIGCTAGGNCQKAANAMTGTCVAPAADGARCGGAMDPPCFSPAHCTNNVCTLFDPSSCK